MPGIVNTAKVTPHVFRHVGNRTCRAIQRAVAAGIQNHTKPDVKKLAAQIINAVRIGIPHLSTGWFGRPRENRPTSVPPPMRRIRLPAGCARSHSVVQRPSSHSRSTTQAPGSRSAADGGWDSFRSRNTIASALPRYVRDSPHGCNNAAIASTNRAVDKCCTSLGDSACVVVKSISVSDTGIGR